jgi:hypothetical protein
MKTKPNWPEILETWKSSGKSKQQFCKEYELVYATFLYNWKKLQTAPAASGRFQQVMFEGNIISERIDYHFADGRCICFPASASKDMIRFLVSL